MCSRQYRFLSFLCSLGVVLSVSAQTYDVAKAGTRWWWFGSAVDSVNLEWNLGELHRAGIGAVEITPIYGIQGNDRNELRYLSPEWMQALKQTERIAARYGIQVDMNNGTGWPFGGPWVPLEESACKAIFHDTIVGGKRQVTVEVGRTRQKVKRAAPGGEGWVIDHFDRDAVRHYLEHIDSAFAASGNPYPAAFFNDSYEVHQADWTPTLPQEFQKRRGYSLLDNLDKLVDGDPQVVSDYRETLSDMLLENFTQQWVDWAHSHGVKVRNQAHGSPANLIDVYSAVDIPEIEGFGLSDFGIRGLRTDPGFTRKNFSDVSMLKYASSAAHTTGKRLTSSETFTWLTEHFRTSLSQMKPDLDLMFTCGVNRVFFHGTAYSPKDAAWPGWKFYASVDMSPTNSIWRDAPELMAYIERCQRLLQAGEPDNDFLVYLPVRDMWKKNTETPFMMFDIHHMDSKAPEFIRAVMAIDSMGYDCDYISDRQVEKLKQKGGKYITEGGAIYKGVIDPRKPITVESLSSMARPEELRTLLHLRVLRRRLNDGYCYFMANLTPEDVDRYVSLAVEWDKARWYDPLTDRYYPVEATEGKIRVSLLSGESRFLLTDTSATGVPYRLIRATDSNSRVIDTPWELSFVESAPHVSRTWALESAQTWEHLDDDSVRVTMGTGVYTTLYNMSKVDSRKEWLLDLGDVRESARVYINGKYIATAWSVPFVIDCGKAFHEGRNTIRIEVTNLPANRIADMDRHHIPWRKMKEINIVDINYKKTNYADWAPVPSGLNSVVRVIEK